MLHFSFTIYLNHIFSLFCLLKFLIIICHNFSLPLLAPSKKEKNEKEIQPVGPPRARAMEGPQGMRRRGPRPNRMRLQQQDDSGIYY